MHVGITIWYLSTTGSTAMPVDAEKKEKNNHVQTICVCRSVHVLF